MLSTRPERKFFVRMLSRESRKAPHETANQFFFFQKAQRHLLLGAGAATLQAVGYGRNDVGSHSADQELGAGFGVQLMTSPQLVYDTLE
jgi:hypothetical protein